jgi:hypothetical protein
MSLGARNVAWLTEIIHREPVAQQRERVAGAEVDLQPIDAAALPEPNVRCVGSEAVESGDRRRCVEKKLDADVTIGAWLLLLTSDHAARSL